MDFPTRALIRQKQSENPLLGEYRMYAALKQEGISVPPRTCGRIMAENRRLYRLEAPEKERRASKPHPFTATSRHERWCLDIRYLEKHLIPEIKGPFYVITVLDAFSRAILSSAIFQGQDLGCVLIVLYAAIDRFGPPQALITDNGAVFRAKQLLRICEALEIEKEYIAPRQSWMNLVETKSVSKVVAAQTRSGLKRSGILPQCIQRSKENTGGETGSKITGCGRLELNNSTTMFSIGFIHCGLPLSWSRFESHFNVMRRMSQVQFEHVTSWAGAKIAHERFMNDYNSQPHWAHRHRADNHHSPAEVLGWTTVQRLRSREEVHRIFYASRFLCRLDRLGYAHFRRWKWYGEETLARRPAVIWVHGEALTVEYEETPLAQYTVQYQPDKKHFKEVPTARRLETGYRSPQGQLWELDETLWKLATRLPYYAPPKRRKQATHTQPLLFDEPPAAQA